MLCASHAQQLDSLHSLNGDLCWDFNADIKVLEFLMTVVTQNWQPEPRFYIYIFPHRFCFLSYHTQVFLTPLQMNPSVMFLNSECKQLHCKICNLAAFQQDGDLVQRQTLVMCKDLFKPCSVNRSQESANGKPHRNKESILKGSAEIFQKLVRESLWIKDL